MGLKVKFYIMKPAWIQISIPAIIDKIEFALNFSERKSQKS